MEFGVLVTIHVLYSTPAFCEHNQNLSVKQERQTNCTLTAAHQLDSVRHACQSNSISIAACSPQGPSQGCGKWHVPIRPTDPSLGCQQLLLPTHSQLRPLKVGAPLLGGEGDCRPLVVLSGRPAATPACCCCGGCSAASWLICCCCGMGLPDISSSCRSWLKPVALRGTIQAA